MLIGGTYINICSCHNQRLKGLAIVLPGCQVACCCPILHNKTAFESLYSAMYSRSLPSESTADLGKKCRVFVILFSNENDCSCSGTSLIDEQ